MEEVDLKPKFKFGKKRDKKFGRKQGDAPPAEDSEQVRGRPKHFKKNPKRQAAKPGLKQKRKKIN